MEQPFERLLTEVAHLLLEKQVRVVFAESCTAGLVSASLSRVAGISEVHCGSAVVYRLDTKSRWLGVPAQLLIDPGPVSEPVAQAMAEGVLDRTPEAMLAVSITGHLGPNAPAAQDGLVFVGIAVRGKPTCIIEHRLMRDNDASPGPYTGATLREQRQWQAVEFVLSQVVRTVHQEF